MKPKTAPRITMLNVFGHLNMGDAMLLEALVEAIEHRVAPSALRGVAFDVEVQRRWLPNIDWSERVGNKLPGRSRFSQMFWLAIASLIAAVGTLGFLHYLLPREQRRAIEALKDADLAISSPGGYLEDSNFAYFLNLVQILLACRLSGKVILAPQSIGPVQSRLGQICLRFTLARVDSIFVREQYSVGFVREVMGRDLPSLHKAADLAFWHGGQSGDFHQEWAELGVDHTRPILGITIIAWGFAHSADPAAARQAYIDSLSALVDRATADGYQVVSFNQVVDDLVLGDLVGRLNPKLIIDRGERSSAALAGMIATCELFIGSRFHSAIFALIAGLPTGAISYLPKTSGIMRDLGLDDLVVDIDTVSAESILALYERLRADPVGISQKIKANLAAYKEAEGAFLEYLDEFGRNPAT